MRVVDHLSEDQLKKLNVKRCKGIVPKKKHSENVDWNEIMGVNRDTFRRKRGAIRRR